MPFFRYVTTWFCTAIRRRSPGLNGVSPPVAPVLSRLGDATGLQREGVRDRDPRVGIEEIAEPSTSEIVARAGARHGDAEEGRCQARAHSAGHDRTPRARL